MRGAITDKNDMFVYFEVIRQIQPAAVLDIGMLLKRVGAVTRQLMGREISPQLLLEGLDLLQDTDYEVVHTIYNTVYKDAAKLPDRRYDLAFLLRSEELIDRTTEEKLWQYLCVHADSVVTDCCDSRRMQFIQRIASGGAGNTFISRQGVFTELHVENAAYGIVQF